ncbi:MAG: chorismate-binding protein [Deinococcales bacterium]
MRRSKDLAEDDTLAQKLLADPKERWEHELVIQQVTERLKPLSKSLEIPTTAIMKLPHIQHLYTPITAKLKKNYRLIELTKELHPTPALGGAPRYQALDYIAQAEPLPRGFYAAPLGYIEANQQEGEMVVAIRSAVAQASRLWLFAGAGIVAGSEAEKEWQETALKFRVMLQALEQTHASPIGRA